MTSLPQGGGQVAGGEIHGGKAQPMALDLYQFIHLGFDGWMEQQAGG